jgi:hypothetical protein
MTEPINPQGRTFLESDLKIGAVIDIGLIGETVIYGGVSSKLLTNARIADRPPDPEPLPDAPEPDPDAPPPVERGEPGHLLFEKTGTLSVRVAAYDPPGPEGRVNTRFHILKFTTRDGLVTIRALGWSFPLTLPAPATIEDQEPATAP